MPKLKPEMTLEIKNICKKQINYIMTLANLNISGINEQYCFVQGTLSNIQRGKYYFSSIVLYKFYNNQNSIDYKFSIPERYKNENRNTEIILPRFVKSANISYEISNENNLYTKNLPLDKIPLSYYLYRAVQFKSLLVDLKLSPEEFSRQTNIKLNKVRDFIRAKKLLGGSDLVNIYKYLNIEIEFFQNYPSANQTEIKDISTEEETETNADTSPERSEVSQNSPLEVLVDNQASTKKITLEKKLKIMEEAKIKTIDIFGARFTDENYFKILEILLYE